MCDGVAPLLESNLGWRPSLLDQKNQEKEKDAMVSVEFYIDKPK